MTLCPHGVRAWNAAAMFSGNTIERINDDLVSCLLDSKIIDLEFAAALENLDGTEANHRLIKFLQNSTDREKIMDAIGMEVLASDAIPHSGNAINSVGEKFSMGNGIIPMERDGNGLILATADPFDVKLMDDLRERFHGTITFKLTHFSCIGDFWNKSSRGEDSATQLTGSPVSVVGSVDERIPLDKFFESLVEEAISRRASDMHLENFRGGMRLRIRVDGKLQQIKAVDGILARAIVAKIKIKSGAKVDETRLPQDRRVHMDVSGKNYDLRISILPTIYGENVAIRIFDQGGGDLNFETIGLFPEQIKLLDTLINSKNGLLLLCGPTGCGKTTTLHAILKKISSSEKKVVTIEDPIEYRLDGINQVPVNDEIGLSFASILRSVLRQSPNVIMVGEIRDRETAELAIQAALTGHLVLSTVHCNDAAGAITRLLDFKISAYLIRSCLRGAISQKLLRRPCKSCATLRELSAGERSLFSQFKGVISTVPELHGCEDCSRMGYRGRIAAFDFLVNCDLADAEQRRGADTIFGNFVHCETFGDSAVKLLRSGAATFEDVRQMLLL
ncbi:MAG: GspE/PulE family protein [Puniceicoccales bacterium]|jgi:type IV pilus assembly protein PilB|nr:GspE/PulE family protein [Puniceicoccales bacterium]